MRSKLTLFVSGIFFGGAIDHVILAAMGQRLTPYGVAAESRQPGPCVSRPRPTVLLLLGHRRLESDGMCCDDVGSMTRLKYESAIPVY